MDHLDINIDDIACSIGDEVRCTVQNMIEDALAEYDLTDEEAAYLCDEIWEQWKDWV